MWASVEAAVGREGESMDTIALVRAGLEDAHWTLEQAVEGLTAEQLHWPPPGTANTIAATYGHVVASEDAFVQGTLRGRPLLADSEWAGRTGISLPVPRRGSDWYAWSRRVRVDLPVAREYAAAVYAATDAYIASLSPEALAQPPRAAVPGNQTLSWLLTNLLVLHAVLHAGEISALRGVQGLHGPA
jgi:hypothetical protein